MTTSEEQIQTIKFSIKQDGHQLGIFRIEQGSTLDYKFLGFIKQTLAYSRSNLSSTSKRTLSPWKTTKRLSPREKIFYGVFFDGNDLHCSLPNLDIYWSES